MAKSPCILLARLSKNRRAYAFTLNGNMYFLGQNIPRWLTLIGKKPIYYINRAERVEKKEDTKETQNCIQLYMYISSQA